MKEKVITFIVAFLFNGLLFSGLNYWLDDNKSVNKFLFNMTFFGFFMAVFQVIILPRFNKKNKQ